ncbi:sensor histidine kinase [Gracilimonas sp.]|uniref:sensor histidine kinase n=1 Tax=Gracilimonas sp. TaxID=1974203 RepID=UPI0028719EFF|nr:HAMP domain-containing sensor histidine kinase [Gracilimonas sp.]
MKILRNRGFRWILLMCGLLAIIALTGMNVLSLYDLRDRMVENEQDRRIDQLDEINDNVMYQILQPLRGLHRLELEPINSTLEQTGNLPNNITQVLARSSQSPFFDGIYYTPESTDLCADGRNTTVYKFDPTENKINSISDYPELICDGIGLVRTKTKIQLNDLNYRWNNDWEFDTHRSLNIGLINVSESRMLGYITLLLDKDYIINEVFPPILTNYFKDSDESGIAVWVRSWPGGDILATNDPDIEYDSDIVDHRMGFSGSGFFDNWSIHMAFLKSPVTTTYNATLVKNLVVLGVAMLFLTGALLFMFFTAQRERQLAQRQASFLANVTHELKTPLAVMQAAGENISDGRVTEGKRLKQYGEHIHNESIRLRSMIEKLLDVARVDSGQNSIKSAPYCVYDLLKNYLVENREYIENKGFEVEFIASDKSSLAMLDSDNFETIVSNLTENAIKYSSEDKYFKFQVSSDKGHVFVSITDRGIGIRKRDQRNIFKKFYRVEDSDSMSNKVKGHGLGLSIVKNMVDMNGGDIEVSSTFGEGTTFILSFPKLENENVDPAPVQKTEDTASLNQKIEKHTEHVG